MKAFGKVDRYLKIQAHEFFSRVTSEKQAREFMWEMKFGKEGYKCSECESKDYWSLECRPEIRECRSCGHQERLRVGTCFENSKKGLLVWMRALYFVTQDKRGISALQLQRQLGLRSYQTAWSMLLRIRRSLGVRDERYQLSGTVEFDGAYFLNDRQKLRDHYYSGNKKDAVLIAVEQKKWVDEKGREKSKAGFAKIYITQSTKETKEDAQKFVTQSIRPRSKIVTDGKFKNFQNVTTNSKAVSGDNAAVKEHLPWVHKFISNSKRWMMGTHHGRIDPKYLKYYLAEYTFRFNRRHDPNALFSRAMAACCEAKSITLPALTG
jgi:hypothetical protein